MINSINPVNCDHYFDRNRDIDLINTLKKFTTDYSNIRDYWLLNRGVGLCLDYATRLLLILYHKEIYKENPGWELPLTQKINLQENDNYKILLSYYPIDKDDVWEVSDPNELEICLFKNDCIGKLLLPRPKKTLHFTYKDCSPDDNNKIYLATAIKRIAGENSLLIINYSKDPYFGRKNGNAKGPYTGVTPPVSIIFKITNKEINNIEDDYERFQEYYKLTMKDLIKIGSLNINCNEDLLNSKYPNETPRYIILSGIPDFLIGLINNSENLTAEDKKGIFIFAVGISDLYHSIFIIVDNHDNNNPQFCLLEDYGVNQTTYISHLNNLLFYNKMQLELRIALYIGGAWGDHGCNYNYNPWIWILTNPNNK